MRERFVLDPAQNILFINFAGLKIESRAQVDEMAEHVRGAYLRQGRRFYAIVNYEGTEIAPDVVDYYGEQIKTLADDYGLATMRYSASGLTRSVLRYLGAAKDLESNIYATRAEAINAIQEIERRWQAKPSASFWALLQPRRSVLAKLLLGWAGALLALFAAVVSPTQSRVLLAFVVLLIVICLSAALLFFEVLKPLRQMESFARGLIAGNTFEPLAVQKQDEVGQLARALNETGQQLRRDIERLSGLYHISLLMSTGTEVGKLNELLTRKVARLLDAEMCVILLYDDHERALSAQLPAYGVDDEKLRQLRATLTDKTIATWVFTTGEAYLTNDPAQDPLISHEAAALLGARQLLAVPLQAGERKLGTLEVLNKPGGFHEDDKQLVTIFAAQAAQLLANAQLFQQVIANERLAAVGELVAGVAHEVRNPLCGITTTLSALERKLSDRESLKPFVDVMKTEADHLNQLMERLLEHSRPARFDAAPTDLRNIIEEVLAEFARKAESQGVTLTSRCQATQTRLRLDRLKMHGVFVNLLDNALQHATAGGEICVQLSTASDAAEERLQIEISDNGCGIPPENLGKIFAPFFTTRPSGTGLGLAITRKTVHDHGGTISVQSEPHKGSSFIINLPVTNV